MFNIHINFFSFCDLKGFLDGIFMQLQKGGEIAIEKYFVPSDSSAYLVEKE